MRADAVVSPRQVTGVSISAAFASVLALASCSRAENSPAAPAPAPARQVARTEPSAPPEPVTAADCERYAATVCSRTAECFPGELVEMRGDEAACRRHWNRLCEHTIAIPHSGTTHERLQACIESLAASDCAHLDVGAGACADPPGELADGAVCVQASQCAGLSCRIDQPRGNGCGRCETLPGEGASCSDVGACAIGLDCRDDRCAPPLAAAVGQACAANIDCAHTLECVRGRCAARGTAGQPCGDAHPSCGPALSCRDGKCVPKQTIGLHDPCRVPRLTFGTRGDPLCPPGTKCRAETPGGDEGTCEPPLADGASCVDHRWDCELPARCIDGACTIPTLEACTPGT